MGINLKELTNDEGDVSNSFKETRASQKALHAFFNETGDVS